MLTPTLNSHINDCLLWQNDRATAVLKRQPSDFIVNEILDWDFKKQGEHIFLYVEKTNCNTAWVAKQLAKFYAVPPRDIGYSGLKDRHAVTRQYFSVRYPGVKPDTYDLPQYDRRDEHQQPADYRIISHVLHDKKLKRGNHSFNDFVIRLHEVDGDKRLIEERLAFIRDNGCPNLFDAQRFGRDNNNLLKVAQWLNGDIDVRKRNEKSLLLSALRSALFNRQLAERVQNNTWQQLCAGDTVILDGSNSHFTTDNIDETLQQRAAQKDLHPAGILIGENDNLDTILNTSNTSNTLSTLNKEHLQRLLRQERLQTAYRPLRLVVKDLHWHFEDDHTCIISMRLPPGAYASGVIRQVFDL